MKYSYTELPQNQMSVVYTDSVEPTAEAPNGPAELVLDGNINTYWHTRWNGQIDPPPHMLEIDLGQTVENLGSVTLTPRQGTPSGRVNEYIIATSADERCTSSTEIQNAEVWDALWEVQVSGDVAANPAPASREDPVVIDFDAPVKARCVLVVYSSSWGGNNGPEQVASLGEFEAFTAVEDANGRVPSHPVTPPPAPPTPSPDSAVTFVNKGVWGSPDDTPASAVIDQNGNFFFQQAHALYSKTDHRAWSFFSGRDFDQYQKNNELSNSGTNPDTTAFCNASPTGKESTRAADADSAGATHSEANYCDLTNIWIDPDTGDWYGLVHNEFTPKPFADGLHYDSIDYAVSHDGGKNWEIPGHAITSPYSTERNDTEAFPESTYYYGDGDPRLYVDYSSGYFYAFYGSRIVNKGGGWVAFHEHVARAPISGKMATGTWQKWYDGAWTEPGVGGKESNIVPVTDENPNGYTAPDKEYKPTTPGYAAEQVANGTTPPTSPLFVMDITYNAYLGLYIGQPQNPDQTGKASQEFYATDNLATQKWYYLGNTGANYYNNSWYRWFLDSGNKTSSAITGKYLRSYCSFGCMNGASSEYINLQIDPNEQWKAAQTIGADKAYAIRAAEGSSLASLDGVALSAEQSVTEDNGGWVFHAVGDGSYTITNKAGKALGVDSSTTAGRAWDAALTLSDPAEDSIGQQWFILPATDAQSGKTTGEIRLVNRYSSLAIGLGDGKALTTPQRSWDVERAVSTFAAAENQVLTLVPFTVPGNSTDQTDPTYSVNPTDQTDPTYSVDPTASTKPLVDDNKVSGIPQSGAQMLSFAGVALALLLAGAAAFVVARRKES